MNLSLLYPGHANDLHIKTACDPPRTFRHPSICPGIDHQVSGRNLLTPRTISTPIQVNYDHVAFATASLDARLATLPRQAEWEAYVAQFQGCRADARSDEKWQRMERIF